MTISDSSDTDSSSSSDDEQTTDFIPSPHLVKMPSLPLLGKPQYLLPLQVSCKLTNQKFKNPKLQSLVVL